MEVHWGSGVSPQPPQIRLSPVSGIIAEQHNPGERLEDRRLGNGADARVRFSGGRVEVGMTNPTDQDRVEWRCSRFHGRQCIGSMRFIRLVSGMAYTLASDGKFRFHLRQNIVTNSQFRDMGIVLIGCRIPKNAIQQWFGQFRFSSWSGWLVELSENSELRAGAIGQAKSTGYFMKLRDWPEFDLIHPAGANRLIVCSKTV